MRDVLTGLTTNLRRGAPVVLAVALLSLGADSGYAARSATHSAYRPTFTLTLGRRTVILEPGGTARVRVIIRRHDLRRVGFRLLARLPAGISARFSRRRTRRHRTTLVISADATAPTGRYRLRIRGRSGHVRKTVTLTLNLGVASGGQLGGGLLPPFTIGGSVADPLVPGTNRPLNLAITNPNPVPLELTKLSVTLRALTAPRATAVLPCGPSDFSVVQYAGPPLTIPATRTRSLSDLGVPPGEWPQVSLIDRATDQDGCQGATLALNYGADARLG
jgi:hypothetical protein